MKETVLHPVTGHMLEVTGGSPLRMEQRKLLHCDGVEGQHLFQISPPKGPRTDNTKWSRTSQGYDSSCSRPFCIPEDGEGVPDLTILSLFL